MSTNYYLIYNICSHCNRYDTIHLGKISTGWQFVFHVIRNINLKNFDYQNIIADQDELVTLDSYIKMKDFLTKYVKEFHTAKIIDEYDSDISLKDFFDIVEISFSNPKNKNHTIECRNQEPSYSFLDNEGYSFIDTDFS